VSAHPFRDVALVGVHNTAQARRLEGRDSLGVTVEAALGAVDDAGLDVRQVDGVVGELGREVIYQARLGPAWRSPSSLGIPAVLEAATAIACGLARVVVVCVGAAGVRGGGGATAPWTRPTNELVVPFGMFTAPEFALVARQHMERYGTTPEALATVAATIRNNGHVNPEAVYFGKGPFTPADVLASRMVADPFHLLDCATTSEGGCAVVLAHADVAADLRWDPVFIAGGGTEAFGPSYEHAPTFGLGGARRADLVNGWVGRQAAERAWARSGLGPDDVDVCELYDPFSFEVIRQFEAFGFCGEGEGGDLVLSGAMGPDGRWPTTTDGGTMSFGHAGAPQLLQRVARGVQQLRGACPTRQVAGAEVALCSGGGSGALFTDVLLLTRHRP
jgi:acetyl-CoA acetyltransferase